MARGITSIVAAQEDVERRKAAGGGGKLFFKLPKNNDSAVVRALEQGDDLQWAWVHQLPPEPGKVMGRKIPCRDQNEDGDSIGAACPGCDKNYPRSFQGVINLIWRDGPVYRRDENNRMVKDSSGDPIVDSRADVVAVWQAGITVFGELIGKDATYKGLSSRDFRVTRKGTGLSTTYSIDPADPDGGPQPMSEADKALAEEKYDLSSLVTAPEYEDWGKAPQKQTEGSDTPAPSDATPFTRRD